MKVLHIIPSVGPVRGGPSQAALEIVKALQDSGVAAEIVTTNDNGPDLLDVPLGQRIEYHQVPTWFFPRFSPPIKLIREFAFSGDLTAWLWQHMAEYDIVHVHALFSYACTVAMVIARIKKVPYIVRPLGLLCAWSLQQSALKKRIYLSLIERANLNHSQALEFTALQELEEAAPLGLKPPGLILPFGLLYSAPIPEARHRLSQHLGVSLDEPIVLFMSRVHHKKGLDYLIPALGKLKDQQFTFVLAGSGSPEYEAEIDTLLKTSGIHNRTHWMGFAQGEMKELLLQGSDIFALTSHSESFGLAVLEAMAAGLAVVITLGVPLAPVVEQHQLGTVTELDIGAIAAALDRSLDDLRDAQKTKARGDRARQLILEKYTWDRIASNLIELYTVILKQEPIPALY